MPPTDLDMHINLLYCLWRCTWCVWGKALHSRLPLNVILIHLDWEIYFLPSIKVSSSSHLITISLYLQKPREEMERFSVLFKSGTLSSEMDCVAWAKAQPVSPWNETHLPKNQRRRIERLVFMREGRRLRGRGIRCDIKMRRHEVEPRGHDPFSQRFNYEYRFS